MTKKFKQHKELIYVIIGLVAVSLIVLPYLILGEGSYIQLHDQMDGEILNYIYQAKYFLKGDIVPEFMNGMDKCAMLPPAPFGVLFYLLLSPYKAFVAMQWFLLIIGFMGMYKLCSELKIKSEVSLAVSVIFCFMPFYPTYGLASLGQPMLVLAAIYLLGDHSWTKKVLACGMIALYAGFSSLALIGFVWLVIGGCVTMWNLLKKQIKRAFCIGFGTGVMTLVYMLTNLDLIESVLGTSGFVSHREEMIVAATPDLWERAKSLLFVGGPYSNVYSSFILLAALLSLITINGIRKWKKGVVVADAAENEKVLLRCSQVMTILILLVLGIIWATMWNSEYVLNVRNTIGGMITYFHADRVSWIFPFMWVMILAYVLDILLICCLESQKRVIQVLCVLAGLGLCLVQGAQVFRDSTLNKNSRLVLFEDYEQVTWKSFYMEEVFEEMKAYMEEDNSTYSVVSLGMYPSVALYNGFTCADGYSNNYDLEYKHEFVKIIEKEMAKYPEVEARVETWGNRLYLASGQYGMATLIEKGSGITFENLEYDLDAMRDLNIRYLLSAGEIVDAQEMGITLVREEPFSSENSYYEIWLYEIP